MKARKPLDAKKAAALTRLLELSDSGDGAALDRAQVFPVELLVDPGSRR